MLHRQIGLAGRLTAHRAPVLAPRPRWQSTYSNIMSPSSLSADAKLAMLREIMAARRIDAYIVPSEDDHSSEYLADCDKRRAYISNFDGSAGVAVVTAKEARLWTDGRYWLQASQQLSKQWDLMKQGQTEVPKLPDWIAKLEKPARIGVDPRLLPLTEYNKLKDAVKPKPRKKDASSTSTTQALTIVPLEENLIDLVWATETDAAAGRHARTANPVFVLEEQYAGSGLQMKLDDMRSKLDKAGASALVVTMLDEVAWLFNLRGSDIEYNPVFFAYAILTPSECTLFAQEASLSSKVKQYLAKYNVQVQPYDEVWTALKSLGETAQSRIDQVEDEAETTSEEKEAGGKVLIGKKTSAAVVNAIGEDRTHTARSPITDAKSIKNETEIEGFRQCHIRDGAALVRYFAWLEEQLLADVKISEYDAATRLEEFRKEGDLFKGLSFDTISSTGPNGAIIHYKPSATDSHIIDKDAIYLCDSGAQYLDGTTDTTRTLHFGQPKDEEKRAFTRVLQGHIAIDRSVFPVGTSGFQLDVFARKALWEDGLDYRHGTGHGIGSFLNVHEGPQGIGMHILYHDTPLKEGMVISNEPGYYADGKFGIRIENVVVVRAASTPHNFGDKGYLGMEHVTMVPIQRSLVDADLLVPAERAWLDAYHAEVLNKVGPLLREKGDERALRWLERECQAL